MIKQRQQKPATAARANHFDEDRLKNRIEAHRFLIKNGFKRSQSQFFDDCAKGFLLVAEDGSLSRHDVLEYGRSIVSDLNKIPSCPFIEKAIKKEAKRQARIQKKQIEALRKEIPRILEETILDQLFRDTPKDVEKKENYRLLSIFEDITKTILTVLLSTNEETQNVDGSPANE